MTAGFSHTAKQPGFIALAVVASLGWIVAIWSVSSSSREEAQFGERFQQLEAEHRAATSQLAEFQQTAGTAESPRNQLRTARADLANLKQQQEQLVQTLSQTRNDVVAAEQRLQQAREAHAKAQQDLSATQVNLTELEQQRSDAARMVGELAATRDRLMAEVQQASESHKTLQQQLSGVSSQLDSRHRELSGIEQQISTVRAASHREDAPGDTGSTASAQGQSSASPEEWIQQTYRCDDDGGGWTCTAAN